MALSLVCHLYYRIRNNTADFKDWVGAGTEDLSRTEEPAKASDCARDRRALQQLALKVHVKHSDLTWYRDANPYLPAH